METNRVLIADDHTIVRSGIKLIIQNLLPSTVIDEVYIPTHREASKGMK